MLKKAGILVAATAAGLLAVSPLAFAGDKPDHDGHGGNDGDRQVNRVDNERETNQNGLVNLGDVNVLNDAIVCPAIPIGAGVNVLGILGGASGEASSDNLTCVNDSSTNQGNFD